MPPRRREVVDPVEEVGGDSGPTRPVTRLIITRAAPGRRLHQAWLPTRGAILRLRRDPPVGGAFAGTLCHQGGTGRTPIPRACSRSRFDRRDCTGARCETTPAGARTGTTPVGLTRSGTIVAGSRRSAARPPGQQPRQGRGRFRCRSIPPRPEQREQGGDAGEPGFIGDIAAGDDVLGRRVIRQSAIRPRPPAVG